MDIWMLWPALALIAGAAALVPLGHQVLQRGVVFIDLAVAQAAAAGSLWAMVVLHRDDAEPWRLVDGASVGGSLLCAAIVAWLSRRWPERREALIGLLYVLFASLALLGARLDAHGRDRMLELLAADVLWAQAPQVLLLAAAAVLPWALLKWRPRWLLLDIPFYTVFALIVSVAVPVLGLFVVFALLIGPALWCAVPQQSGSKTATRSPTPHRGQPPPAREMLPAPKPLWWPFVFGAIAAVAGLLLSAWWDVPSGPCVALSCALMGLGALARRAPKTPR